MRWIFPSLVVLLCCAVLASKLSAQTVAVQKQPKQSVKYAKKTSLNAAFNQRVSDSPPEVTLRARPISCATLRQGQPCYVRFSMSWESTQPISACLVSEQSDEGTCWENKNSGEFKKELYLTETTVWDLQSNSGESFGQVKVSVAWVYRSSRVRRNWRLF